MIQNTVGYIIWPHPNVESYFPEGPEIGVVQPWPNEKKRVELAGFTDPHGKWYALLDSGHTEDHDGSEVEVFWIVVDKAKEEKIAQAREED